MCFQETWSTKQDLKLINNLHESFHGIGVSTTDYSDGVVHGHPPGGVTIMWNITFEKYMKPLDLNLDWYVAAWKMLFENLLPVPSPEKRGGLGVGPATPPHKNSLATETETREKTAPGSWREAEQATGLMKDGDQTRKEVFTPMADLLTPKTFINIG